MGTPVRHPLIRALGPQDRPYVSLAAAEALGLQDLSGAPRTLRILAEGALRASCPGPADPGGTVTGGPDAARAVQQGLDAARAVLAPPAAPGRPAETVFRPTRVLLQDHSGIPVLADLASMRSLLADAGAPPTAAAPRLPVDLVVDHSVEAEAARRALALQANMDREHRLNAERYRFLRWAQDAFPRLRVVPPGRGIVHQIHLEHLARVVLTDERGLLAPDTVLGTDSHTPMINALGVLGWGVGGIEATLAILGLPVPLSVPEVVGVRLTGTPAPAVLATDIALAMTEFLRDRGVVGAYVEFHGPGAAALAVPDRATLANMAPEYGCTAAFFPTDRATLEYLRLTGRPPGHVDLVERYTKEQGLFATEDESPAAFGRRLEFDLGRVVPSVAGPRRPQQRLPLADMAAHTARDTDAAVPGTAPSVPAAGPAPAGEALLDDGAVAVAALTSCTNTSNPQAMITAGLLARNAVRRGLTVPPWVKTSLAPGSRVVTAYLSRGGLLESLAKLGFDLVGYGCTTCIGNSGPLFEPAARAARSGRRLAAVLSGNRNFEGRIHASVTDAYLMSPPMVVALALAGTVRIDPVSDPLGTGDDGRPVRLADLWPRPEEVARQMAGLGPGLYRQEREELYDGDARWRAIDAPTGATYDWPEGSTYLRRSPLVTPADRSEVPRLRGARVLVMTGDATTTDHISPAGAINTGSLAAEYLREKGVPRPLFNSYGCRRGNPDVMMRGTFANPRLCNLLTPDRPGDWTLLLPGRTPARIFTAAHHYAAREVPLIVLAGRDYGMGSSRDWAAKGPYLLGVRAVLAEGFERIHRSNLIGMGILPLQFAPGDSAASLGLTGEESFDIDAGALVPRGEATVCARRDQDPGPGRTWTMTIRVDTREEADCLRQGGFLRAATARLLAGTAGSAPGTAPGDDRSSARKSAGKSTGRKGDAAWDGRHV